MPKREDCPVSGSKNAHLVNDDGTVKCFSESGGCNFIVPRDDDDEVLSSFEVRRRPDSYAKRTAVAPHVMRTAVEHYTWRDLFAEEYWLPVIADTKAPLDDEITDVHPDRFRSREYVLEHNPDRTSRGQAIVPAYGLMRREDVPQAPVGFIDIDVSWLVDETGEPLEASDYSVQRKFRLIDEVWDDLPSSPSISGLDSKFHVPFQLHPDDAETWAILADKQGITYDDHDVLTAKRDGRERKLHIDVYAPNDAGRYVIFSPWTPMDSSVLDTEIPILRISDILQRMPELRPSFDRKMTPTKYEMKEYLSELESLLPVEYTRSNREDVWRVRLLKWYPDRFMAVDGRLYAANRGGSWDCDEKIFRGIVGLMMEDIKEDLLRTAPNDLYRAELEKELNITNRKLRDVAAHISECWLLKYTEDIPKRLLSDVNQARIIQWSEGGGFALETQQMLSAEDLVDYFVFSRPGTPSRKNFVPKTYLRWLNERGGDSADGKRLYELMFRHFGSEVWQQMAYLLKTPPGKTFDCYRAPLTNFGKSTIGHAMQVALGDYVYNVASATHLNSRSSSTYTGHMIGLDTAFINIYHEVDKLDKPLPFTTVDSAWCTSDLQVNFKYGFQGARIRTAHVAVFGNDWPPLVRANSENWLSRYGYFHEWVERVEPLTPRDFDLMTRNDTSKAIILTHLLLTAKDAETQAGSHTSNMLIGEYRENSRDALDLAIEDLFELHNGNADDMTFEAVIGLLEENAAAYGLGRTVNRDTVSKLLPGILECTKRRTRVDGIMSTVYNIQRRQIEVPVAFSDALEPEGELVGDLDDLIGEVV